MFGWASAAAERASVSEAFSRSGPANAPCSSIFSCDDATELHVAGVVDDAHAAAAEQPEHP
jgi:hypothetical protein